MEDIERGSIELFIKFSGIFFFSEHEKATKKFFSPKDLSS